MERERCPPKPIPAQGIQPAHDCAAPHRGLCAVHEYSDELVVLLFFDRAGPTKHVWYYEQPLPEGKKNYTKTAPLQFEEFARCLKWRKKRQENDQAWKVPAADLIESGCNLDRKNPRAKEDIMHLPPEKLAESILARESRIAEIMHSVQRLLVEQ